MMPKPSSGEAPLRQRAPEAGVNAQGSSCPGQHWQQQNHCLISVPSRVAICYIGQLKIAPVLTGSLACSKLSHVPSICLAEAHTTAG